MISSYEKQYMSALINIYENGFSDGVNERTKRATKRLPGVLIQVDVEKEFPILKSKQVFGKTSLREILWIWQQQSNNIHDLKAKIWDEWADENGSIGDSYGAQITQPVNIYTDPIHKTPESFRSYRSQAHYILEYLREFPNGRWGVSTIWNPAKLSRMNLVPCCHTTTWNLDGGRLNCVLDQRSGDMPYGVPFNTTQYAELMILFARDLGVKPGLLTHVIADAHIYDNQMEGVEKQIANYRLLEKADEPDVPRIDLVTAAETILWLNSENEQDQKMTRASVIEQAIRVVQSTPKFEVKAGTPADFFQITVENTEITDYDHMGRVDFGDVAV